MSRLVILLILCLFACRSAPVPAPAASPPADLAAAERLDREGIELFQRGDLPAATGKLTAALELCRRARSETAEASVTGKLAFLYAQAGNAEQALAFGARARELFHHQGDRLSEASMFIVVGSLQADQGNPQAAYDTLSAALPLLEPGDDPQQLATVLQLLGEVSSRLQRDEEALAAFARAGEIFHQLKDPLKEASCLRGEVIALRAIGFTADELGEPLKALASFQRVLAMWEKLGDHRQQALALGDLGLLQTSLDELHDALRSFDQARDLARKVPDAELEARILLLAATTHESLGDLRQALVVAQRALEIFRSLPGRQGEALALMKIGALQIGQAVFHQSQTEVPSLFRAAAEPLEEALRIWRKLGDEEGEARALSKLGDIYQILGERQKLEGLLGRARELATVADTDSEPDLLEMIGWALVTETDAGQAREALAEALALRQARRDTAGEARVLSSLGFCSEIDKDLPGALDSYMKSIVLQETLQARGQLDFLKVGIGAAAVNTYERAVLVGLRLGRTAQAFEIAERSRARLLVTSLTGLDVEGKNAAGEEWVRKERELRAALVGLERRAAEEPGDLQARERLAARRTEYNEVLSHLRDAEPETADLLQPQTVSLAEVQRRLDERTALLSYFVTSERSVAFVVTHSTLEAVELPVKRRDLAMEVDALESGAPAVYAALSRWLIEPVADKLRAPVVGIVPHAMLHYVPFAALRDGKSYFGEAHALFHLPAAALLPAGPHRAGPPARLNPLVMAYSPSGNERGQIRRVYDEVQSIARLFGVDPVLREGATPTEFLSRARGHGIVHLAAHAQLVSDNPLSSFIRLAPGDGSADGSLYLHQIYGLELPGTELVVLSACETAAGGESRGDGIVALNRGFLYAGAAAVLASLWRVGDKPTRVLMEAFYRRLISGASKAEALQAAQAETRRRFPLPVDWAGFVLTGDPGPIVMRPTTGQPASVPPASPTNWRFPPQAAGPSSEVKGAKRNGYSAFVPFSP